MPEFESHPYELQTAKLRWRDSDVPVASDFEDIYFSAQHGLAETRHVFLQHNRLAERWAGLQRPHFTIGETGFGTGLNFLAACQLWQQTAPKKARLQFISVEKHPLGPADLERALSTWPELAPWSSQLLAQYPVLTPGYHLLQFNDGIRLHLLLGDALRGFEQLQHCHLPGYSAPFAVDAWFLDGFAPAKNPELWSDSLLQTLARLSRPNTSLATFTAVGDVRRQLSRCGFSMQKVKGFGSKREMLTGLFIGNTARGDAAAAIPEQQARRSRIKAPSTPWYISNHKPTAGRHAAIIGAGLAGSHSAWALAQRGWQISLIDSHSAPAQAASGNPQGMLYTSLSPEAGQLNQFHLSSYLYATGFYRRLLAEQILPPSAVNFCGLLQLAHSDKLQSLLPRLKAAFGSHPQLVSFHSRQSASELAGIELKQAGWFFPQSGWLSPAVLCQRLTEHPAITLQTHTRIDRLQQEKGGWQLLDAQGDIVTSSDVVIIANSYQADHFQQTQGLPLKAIRGQITECPASELSRSLNCVVCHDGYITPELSGKHHLGATFDLNNRQTAVQADDHQRNLQSLLQHLPQLIGPNQRPTNLNGWAGVRCASADYLPLLGLAHQQQAFIEDYAKLGSNSHARIEKTGRYYPGLYLNIAHGSRGLTTTPLCAELLAAIINGEPPPLPRNLITALNPARFTLRDIIRGTVRDNVRDNVRGNVHGNGGGD